MVFVDTDPDLQFFNDEPDCRYYNDSTFREKFGSESNSLRIMHLNIRSANKNFDELLLYLQIIAVEIHVIVLTETWLNDSSDWFEVPGFVAHHSIRAGRRGGGVSILVKSYLESQLVEKFTLVRDLFEICTVCVTVNHSKHNIIGVYRPPNASLVQFNENFFNVKNDNDINRNFAIVLGDFNVDISADVLSEASIKFIAEFSSLHCVLTITVPTRVTDNSFSVVDHIWLNSLSPYSSGVFPVHISDHYPIFISLPNVFLKSVDLVQCKYRCHDECNMVKFEKLAALVVENMQSHGDLDSSEQCKIFIEDLFEAYGKSFPIKTKRVSVKRLSSP